MSGIHVQNLRESASAFDSQKTAPYCMLERRFLLGADQQLHWRLNHASRIPTLPGRVPLPENADHAAWTLSNCIPDWSEPHESWLTYPLAQKASHENLQTAVLQLLLALPLLSVLTLTDDFYFAEHPAKVVRICHDDSNAYFIHCHICEAKQLLGSDDLLCNQIVIDCCSISLFEDCGTIEETKDYRM